MQVLLISPYHGRSSHAAWGEGYRQHSRHRVETLVLSDRAWAWRMRGGALGLYEALQPSHLQSDVLLATSMTDLSGFLGLVRRTPLAGKPAVLYMHENQLTYPIRKEGLRDPGLAWIQFQASLCADRVWFNSEHNRSSWFRALPKFLQGLPEAHGQEQLEALEAKSEVMPVGLSLPWEPPTWEARDEPPILVWNQRWDWDKNPDAFCDLVDALARRIELRVVLLGATPQREPPNLTELKARLGDRLLHAGWCSRAEYEGWLRRATLTVSTARHEFFGISILEAAAFGVLPLLPRRLAYPELFDPQSFPQLYYRGAGELEEKALQLLTGSAGSDGESLRRQLQANAYRFAWTQVAPRYDEQLTAGPRR